MLGRLVRILLALATAFVFTAQVEAATAHCARLAQASSVAAEAVKADMPTCHDMRKADAGTHHPAPHKQPAQERCQCIAVLSECAPVLTTVGSSRIEPYAWTAPEAETIASTEPTPALRPPRI